MKIGAFQFDICNDTNLNWKNIKEAIYMASKQNVELLVFPECALTGYPPIDIPDSKCIQLQLLESIYAQIQKLSNDNNMFIIIGSILLISEKSYNSALMFKPGHKNYSVYRKRALWGWDRENFTSGSDEGVISINGFNVGIRICFEVRFPEYFRELYERHTNLNIIMFYDTSSEGDNGRYDLIMGHIRTRAVENVCYTLTVNTSKKEQTAPTAIIDKSGTVLQSVEINTKGLLVYSLDDIADDFGERGRREISDIISLSHHC